MATFFETARIAMTRAWGALRSFWVPPFLSGSGSTWYGSAPTSSGVTMSETAALNLSAIWCGVQVIAGSLATLPLILYRRDNETGRRERFYEHPLYRILHDEPNPEMSDMLFRETLTQHALLWGNGYAEIQRDQGGRVRALLLLTPDRVQIKRDPQGRLYYDVYNG